MQFVEEFFVVIVMDFFLICCSCEEQCLHMTGLFMSKNLISNRSVNLWSDILH